jgi:FkbM family methyltransferase
VARGWLGEAVLRAPDSLRALRRVPVLGALIHAVSHRILDLNEKVWTQVEAGPVAGLWLGLNPRTGQAYARGDMEPAVQNALADHLRPGDVFYDLGANIGFYTLLAARAVGARGKVFSFEPDFENARRLERNVARNGFANVSIIEAGVWSSSGERNFSAANAGSPDRGVGSFVYATGGAESVTAIPCVSIDDFALSAPPPAGIKCDVEGAEVEVLRGARASLARHRPWLLCETQNAENARAVRAILSELAYSIEEIDDVHLFAAP